MIGLIFLFGIATWVAASAYLSKLALGLLGPRWRNAPVRAAIFVALLILPVTDEIVGRWQLNRLCESEAVVWLSPEWKSVKAVRRNDHSIQELTGYAIPIRVQQIEYVDSNTDAPFLAYKAFHTKGGVLFGTLGLGLETSMSCRPTNASEILKAVDIDQLLKPEGVK